MGGYFVIGKNISYSKSPEIHGLISKETGIFYPYSVKNMDEDQAEYFFERKDFEGLNVTVPYKKTAAKKCDVLSEFAKKTGSVNTVKNKNGILYGFNTDIRGFLAASESAGFDYKNKYVVVMGTGGAAMSVRFALETAGASEIHLISRTGKDPDNYESMGLHSKADYLINGTPVGMNNYSPDASPADLAVFERLSGVMDLIYSPRVTKLLSGAISKNIRCMNGLYMLVSQAVYAAEIFTDCKFDEKELTLRILKELK